jgi:hypothetical protein
MSARSPTPQTSEAASIPVASLAEELPLRAPVLSGRGALDSRGRTTAAPAGTAGQPLEQTQPRSNTLRLEDGLENVSVVEAPIRYAAASFLHTFQPIGSN